MQKSDNENYRHQQSNIFRWQQLNFFSYKGKKSAQYKYFKYKSIFSLHNYYYHILKLVFGEKDATPCQTASEPTMSQVAGSLWTEFYFKSAPPAATELNIPPAVDIPSAGDIPPSVLPFVGKPTSTARKQCQVRVSERNLPLDSLSTVSIIYLWRTRFDVKNAQILRYNFHLIIWNNLNHTKQSHAIDYELMCT